MKPLPIGTRVRVLRHRPGWTGEVAYHSDTCGFYTLRNLRDPWEGCTRHGFEPDECVGEDYEIISVEK